MWQACPICKGMGVSIAPNSLPSLSFITCSTCNGTKIISELTGRPPTGMPIYDPNKTNTTNGNTIPT
jgi:hypothetical protein